MDSYEHLLADIDIPYQLHYYYSQDQAEFKKEKVEKKTEDHISELSKFSNQQQQKDVFQKSVCIINQEISKFGFKNRTKNRIIVNAQKRKKYLQFKIGKKSKTNDLSVNIGTLLKSTFNQFETFFVSHQQELFKIKQFKNSKSNIKSFKKLLEQNIQNGLKQFEENNYLVNPNFSVTKQNTFRPFIIKYMEQNYLIKKTFISNKMSFPKKLMLIKFFNAISEICKNPEKLSKWKQLLINKNQQQFSQNQR